jgi:5-dehydro-2-deoxygluconokinase
LETRLDLICIGRLCVDLYSEQVGTPMVRVSSFRRYLGGSAANIAVGTARLGLSTALVSRVGDDQFGLALLGDLARERVDTRFIQSDPERLTSVVALALRKRENFPRLFLYRDTADLAFDPRQFDLGQLAQARCLLVTGSYLSRSHLADFVDSAIEASHAAGSKVVIDLDFRSPLWGLAGWGEATKPVQAGPEIASAYAKVLPKCDLVVGTLDEVQAATGKSDFEAAVRYLRDQTPGDVVVKLGAQGALVYERSKAEGKKIEGFAVPLFNSVGAGDGFLSGFLASWLRGASATEAARLGNASGALVASRHGCTPAMPYLEEVERFLSQYGDGYDPSQDAELEHLHWALTRTVYSPDVLVFAMDHRWQLEDMADVASVPRERIMRLKELLFDAYALVASDIPQAGVLLDHTYGEDLLETASGMGHWYARAIEVPRSYPVELAADAPLHDSLRRRPTDEIVKCMVYAHPNEDQTIRDQQSRTVALLAEAARASERELLIELQAPRGEQLKDDDTSRLMRWIYDLGVRPDWWKLPPSASDAVWASIDATIRERDPYCQGFLVLGQQQDFTAVIKSLSVSAAYSTCRGFAVGRTLFVDAARRWFDGEIDDRTLTTASMNNFRRLIDEWNLARAVHG